MYVPRWLGYAVPRQTLDGLWGCLQAETDMWLGRLGKQRVSRPLQSTGHPRGSGGWPSPRGGEPDTATSAPLVLRPLGLSQSYILSTPASSSVQCRCLGCHVSLRSCWVPSLWVSLLPPQPWFFSGKAWWTGDELVLFLCLKSVAPAQGRAVDRNPGAPGPGCPAVLGCLAASEQVGRWAVSETEQDWKGCAHSSVGATEGMNFSLHDVLSPWILVSAMIESLRWQTHAVEDSE